MNTDVRAKRRRKKKIGGFFGGKRKGGRTAEEKEEEEEEEAEEEGNFHFYGKMEIFLHKDTAEEGEESAPMMEILCR